jgi:hypothetical protein
MQNKPNLGSGPAEAGGRLCEAKPIPGYAGRDEARGTGGVGQMCKTKPNLGKMGYLDGDALGRPIVRHRLDASLRETKPIQFGLGEPGSRTAKDAKRTQSGRVSGENAQLAKGRLCETKPIPPTASEGQILCRKRVMVNWTNAELRQNKANPPRPRVGRGLGDEMRLCKTKPICTHREESVGQAPPYTRAQSRQTNPIRPSLQARSLERENVRNEPNWDGCRAGTPNPRRVNDAKQSQPRAGWDNWGTMPPREPIVRNKPSRNDAGLGGARATWGVGRVQTKPIAGGDGFPIILLLHPSNIPSRGPVYKQSQFCYLGPITERRQAAV